VVINEIQPGSLFENAGLVNGDVIQEVNGRAVSGVNDLVSMYRELKPGTSLSIKVTRAGRQVVLNHTVE
jgi:S1-C subfamily serine protease